VKGETGMTETMREKSRRRTTRRTSWLAAAGLLVAAVTGVGASPAGAVPSQTASWSGHGVSVDAEGDVSLGSEVCGTENGAPVDGTYLQWVLVAKGATGATLTLGSDAPVTMERNGNNGTFQYVQTDFEDLADVVDAGASAAYTGKADPKAKVVLGGGCIGLVTLTVVSSVPFGVLAVGLTEAECLTATTTGTATVGFQAGEEDSPSICSIFEIGTTLTANTVVMPVNPALSFTPPESDVALNAAFLQVGGTVVANPACTAVDELVSFCMVTSSTTVTIQAPPA